MRPGSALRIAVLACVGALGCAQGDSKEVVQEPLPAQVGADIGPASQSALASAPPQYTHAEWPKLPADLVVGDMSGVAIDREGNVHALHRGTGEGGGKLEKENAVLVIDPNTGSLVRTWGANTFSDPHGLTIDGEDNIWITDTGLHQVFKFTHDGQLVFKIGEAGVSGWDATHFNRPTQVAPLADGSFYVSDGYGNNRVAKFDREGKFLFEWGSEGTEPGQFDLPHGVVLAPDGTLLVADRENRRLQVFDQQGKFIREWLGAKQTGRVFSASIGPDGATYLAIRPSDRNPLEVGVLKLDDRMNIVAQIGFKDSGDAVFGSAHFVAVGKDGAVYLVETPDKRVSKFVPTE